MSNLVSLKDRLARSLQTVRNARENAKELVTEMVGTVMGGITAAGLGALDEAKGEVKEGDLTGIRVYSVGPVPASLIVGGLGKVAGLALMGDGIAPIANDMGQAGLSIAAYHMGRQAWAKHKANADK